MPTPRRQPSWETALALQVAAEAAARAVPRKQAATRERLREATRRAVHQLMTGAPDRPPPDIATAYFRDALQAALQAGVDRRTLVILFNGDDER